MLEVHVPSRAEFAVRQAWMADPGVMAYNAGWKVSYPGYDRATGCIDWPDDQWPVFEDRLKLPADRQGNFYVLDTDTGVFIGHAHYAVSAERTAQIGINVIPSMRGRRLGEGALRLLVDRIWCETTAEQIVNEFEDDRAPAVRTHRRCGFVPDLDSHDGWRRPTRPWRLLRPTG